MGFCWRLGSLVLGEASSPGPELRPVWQPLWKGEQSPAGLPLPPGKKGQRQEGASPALRCAASRDLALGAARSGEFYAGDVPIVYFLNIIRRW